MGERKHLRGVLNLIEESVIREMTRLAKKYNAINLAQGLPEFDTPDFLKRFAITAIQEGHNQYSFTWGLKELRERVKESDYDPETEVLITCGASEGLASAVLAIVEPGDEVIIIEPFYENYPPLVRLAGGVPVYVKLREPDFVFSVEELESKITDRTKAVILNNPHNPTGKVFRREDLTKIARVASRKGLFVIADETYQYIIYDGVKHIPMYSIKGMRERTITVRTFSKTFSITGWRVGYVLADRRIMDGIRKVHDYLVVCAPMPFQKALATAVVPDEYYKKLRRMYQDLRDYTIEVLSERGFSAYKPQGGYYLFCNVDAYDFPDDWSFVRYMVAHRGIAFVPGSSFYHSEEDGLSWVRLCFAKPKEVIDEVSRRLEGLLIRG